MSAWSYTDLSPQLGAASTPKSHYYPGDVQRWLVSRYLYNRFGTHDPSWDVFKILYDPPETVGATADAVAKLHTQLGTCDRTWATFMDLYDSLKKVADVDDIAALAAKLEPPNS